MEVGDIMNSSKAKVVGAISMKNFRLSIMCIGAKYFKLWSGTSFREPEVLGTL